MRMLGAVPLFLIYLSAAAQTPAASLWTELEAKRDLLPSFH
jgi:hypothetical protein